MLDLAISAGMPVDEFWYGDPELYYNYVRVQNEREKRQIQNIWEIGVRVGQALGSTPVVAIPCFDDKQLKSMDKYPDCPFFDKDEEREYTEAEKERLLIMQGMEMEAFVRSFEKKESD